MAFVRARVVLLAIAVVYGSIVRAEISFAPGLEGTERDLERGLSDKQLGIQNWLTHLADEAANAGDGEWPAELASNATGNLEIQRDMTSYRYSLAFSAYALGLLSFVHTPAYVQPVANSLKTILELVVDERVWSYFGQKGDCAPFFLTTYCEEHDVSMCDLNQLWHADQDLRCGPPADAVYFGNIMFSAHLAQVATFYELFAQQAGGVVETVSFNIAGSEYSLDDLMRRLEVQALENAEELGGGITCEPANMYPSCQSHLFASLRLYNALRSSGIGGVGQGEGEGARSVVDDGARSMPHSSVWQNYLLRRNISPWWNTSHAEGKWGERIFHIVQQTPRRGHIPTSNIPLGCASHDAWVLAWMGSWGTDAREEAPKESEESSLSLGSSPSYQEVLARGRDLLQDHPGWTTEQPGVLKDVRCNLLAGELNDDTGSALFTIVDKIVARGTREQEGDGVATKADEVVARFGGTVGDGVDEFYYGSQYGLDVFVTAQLGEWQAANQQPPQYPQHPTVNALTMGHAAYKNTADANQLAQRQPANL